MYYPNLKTTDSELRALRNLSPEIKRKIFPVFELTRSRKTIKSSGSLAKRAEQLNELYSEGRFILDLSTEPSLMNSETVDLFDESAGYINWKNFLEKNFDRRVIPCALFVEEGSKAEFQQQISWIVDIYGFVCIRTSVADELAAQLYDWTIEVVGQSKIILCPVLYFIQQSEYAATREACNYYIQSVIGNRPPRTLIFVGSSFPRTVMDLPGCLDASGSFQASEIILERDLKTTYPNLPIEQSDFASVHPRRYETKGGTWVPRIDFFDGDLIRYTRIRRDKGGYATAAQKIDTSFLMKMPVCWGREQIFAAKAGVVPGSSPSFWISVRINCWITKRA